MTHLTRVWPLAVAMLIIPAVASATSALSLSDRASLQAAMQRHIDNALVDGHYLYLDDSAGLVRKLRPMSAHPVILRMGPYFVLCADFRGEEGEDVNVDFYIARKTGRAFVVFDEQVENRAVIKRMMRAGRMVTVD